VPAHFLHMTEIWLPIRGYEGLYEVSDLGRVKSLARIAGKNIIEDRLLRGRVTEYGYVRVTLSRDSRTKSFAVHRLVLEAFVGPCPEGMEGCHGNGTPADNRKDNLRWDTPESNWQDKVKHGTAPIGERNPLAKITNEVARIVKMELAMGFPCKLVAFWNSAPLSVVQNIKKGASWRYAV